MQLTDVRTEDWLQIAHNNPPRRDDPFRVHCYVTDALIAEAAECASARNEIAYLCYQSKPVIATVDDWPGKLKVRLTPEVEGMIMAIVQPNGDVRVLHGYLESELT